MTMSMASRPKAFSTSLMGSMPRSAEMLRALRRRAKGEIAEDALRELAAPEVEQILRMQERHGIDFLTSGEIARDSYVSFIADRLEGVRMMSMSDMLPYIDDKAAFEEMLRILDVPAMSIKNAIACGTVERKPGGIVLEELRQMKSMTDCPVKITLPGPYLVTRSMWLPALSKAGYASKEALGEAIIRIYREEIAALQAEGVDIIQFDEPVLTEVVFTEGRPRSFMCASLSEKKDPTEELAFAHHLIHSVLSAVDRKKSRAALHVCRGNWSRDEATLLSGPYSPLVPLLTSAGADVLFLEFSTDRAGELASLFASGFPESITLGLGVVNPRTDAVEMPESIVARAEECLSYLPKERIWLNPDCGFCTFANRPVNAMAVIERKVEAIARARDILRDRYGD